MSAVRCQHLLIKHAGSRNPVSRRTGGSTASVTKKAAHQELLGYLEKAQANPEGFGALCKERSDCGSFAQNGDLGLFKRGEMQKPFEDASFALQVGQLSGVVDTDSGLHIIKRTESSLPGGDATMSAARAGGYKSIDAVKSKQTRADAAVTLRKKNHMTQMDKRRRGGEAPAGAAADEPRLDVVRIPDFVKGLYAADAETVLASCRALRSLVSDDRDPPIDTILAHEGVLQRLCVLLQEPEPPLLQLEVAWVMTNIASVRNATRNYSSAVVESGALPLLMKLSVTARPEVAQQAVWCIGNIAGENIALRDIVLAANYLPQLLRIVWNCSGVEAAAGGAPPNLMLLRNATWCVSNLCMGGKHQNPQIFQPVYAVIAGVIRTCPDEDVLQDACWALYYLTDAFPPQHTIECNILDRIAMLLNEASFEVQLPCIRLFGQLTSTDDHDLTTKVINCGILPCFHQLLSIRGSHQQDAMQKETLWVISNICAGTTPQLQWVIQNGSFTQVVKLVHEGKLIVKKEAMWVLSNAASTGSPAQIDFIIAEHAIEAVVEFLRLMLTTQLKNPRALADLQLLSLDTLDKFFQNGEKKKALEGGDENPYWILLQQCGGEELVEVAQEVPNDDVAEKATKIIRNYCPNGFEEVGEPAVGDSGQQAMAAAGVTPGQAFQF